MKYTVDNNCKIKGKVHTSGDKSLSHRSLLLAGIANGVSLIKGIQWGSDVQATYSCLSQLGVQMNRQGSLVTINGVGMRGLRAPKYPLNCASSGTTMRLFTGILGVQKIGSVLQGSEQLSKRPMNRVVMPLQEWGFQIRAENPHGRPPIVITPSSSLKTKDTTLKVNSAQVKSALTLAALYGSGSVKIHGAPGARDHTEKLLQHMGAKIKQTPNCVEVFPTESLSPLDYKVPADPSSAAFLLAAAQVTGGSVTLEDVCLNPTRLGFVDALKKMGADITITPLGPQLPEPRGQITLRSKPLHGIVISKEMVVSMIDELPIFAVVAATTPGQSIVKGAEELKVKETDRLATTASELKKFGVDVVCTEDGWRIQGGKPLCAAEVESHGDHRIAMSMTVAALCAKGESTISDTGIVKDSFPDFISCLDELGVKIRVSEEH